MAEAGSRKVALVTGATGIVGRYVVMHLLECPDWEVLPVTRGTLEYPEVGNLAERTKVIKVSDLTNKQACMETIGKLEGITHVFHCAYATANDPVEDVTTNMALMQNVVEVVESGPSKSTLKHVYVQTGSKWYGPHLGKYKTPGKEDDPRVPGPMFYYDLYDYVNNRVKGGASWTYSELRPNPVIGYSPTSYMNLLNAIGVYAAITQRLGLPFRFPGSDASYNCAIECVDARVLAAAAVYSSTEPSAVNNSYNVSNGDVYRWSEVWPRIAKHFGLQTAEPMKFSLTQIMKTPEKRAAWQELVKEHSLICPPLDKLVAWEFADFVLSFVEWDFFQNVTKLSRAGFRLQCVDTGDMWIDHLQRLIDMKIIPPLGKGRASGAAPVKLEGSYEAVKAKLEGKGK